MKIFHKKRWKRVVYVQVQDVMYLMNEAKVYLPETIAQRVVLMIGLDEREFFKFEKKEEVLFFKKMDFIVDYSSYSDLTEEEFRDKIKNLNVEINNIVQKWNVMRPNERISNKNLMEEHRNKKYMLKVISEIYDNRCGNISIPFPEFKEKRKK